MSSPIVDIAQGPASVADAEALAKHELGYTHPNLHRMVDPKEPDKDEKYLHAPLRSAYASEEAYRAALEAYRAAYDETSPRSYRFTVGGLNSFRTMVIEHRGALQAMPKRDDYPSDEAFFAAMDEYLRLQEIP